MDSRRAIEHHQGHPEMTPQASTAIGSYGSDANGLICGYVFEPGQSGRPIDSDAAARWIDANSSASGKSFVWLHFSLANAAAEPWLHAHAGLDDEFFEAFSTGSRSTRIERQDEALLAVINDVTFDFAFEASDVATLWVAVRARLVISARRHSLRAVDRLRASVKGGEMLATPLALLDHLLHDQAEELERIAREATERVDDIEDALLAGRAERHSAELARLRRLAVRLQRLLAPDPSALNRTIANPPTWLSHADTQLLLQASEDFALVLRDIGALQERIKLLQDEFAARVAQENNRSLFILTMVTVLALPINLIAGLLGMNVGGIPLAQEPHGFWSVVTLIAVFTLGVGWLALRRLGPRR
jgi:zinc transporter